MPDASGVAFRLFSALAIGLLTEAERGHRKGDPCCHESLARNAPPVRDSPTRMICVRPRKFAFPRKSLVVHEITLSAFRHDILLEWSSACS